MSRASKIEEQAARWLLRREEPSWSVSDQAELDQWLEIGEENKVAYWRLEHGWRQLDRLAALRPPSSSLPHRSKWHRRPRWPIVVSASLVASVAVVALTIFVAASWKYKTYATEVGGRQTIALPDGTKIELNTATLLRTSMSGKSRQVWLDRGEAYFEVTHDVARPFVVYAGEHTITDLGTKFSVWRDSDRFEVTVEQGRVAVKDEAAPSQAVPQIVTAGEIASSQGTASIRATFAPAAVNSGLSWRRGVLAFDQTRLADAAAQFNRYNRKQLIIADPTLAEMRIGGRFDTTNVDGFIRLLRQAYQLNVEDDGTAARVSK